MIYTALIMGLAGSLHCIAMCSPLVITVSKLHPTFAATRFIYNAGRIFVYGILGAIVGTAGWTLSFSSSIQNFLSLLFGISLLFFAVSGVKNIRIPGLTFLLQKTSHGLKNIFARFLKQKNYASIFILGSLNGILPCGLTFIALTFCLTLNSPLLSFYFMLLFGVGTLPVMLGFTGLFQYVTHHFNITFKNITSTLLFVCGCLLIVRVLFFHHTDATHDGQQVVDIILCR